MPQLWQHRSPYLSPSKHASAWATAGARPSYVCIIKGLRPGPARATHDHVTGGRGKPQLNITASNMGDRGMPVNIIAIS